MARKPYIIPVAYIKSTKDELQMLFNIGVLTRIKASQWLSPSFVVPKKDNTPRLVTDFRSVNARIKREPFPLPHIQEVLQSISTFKWATVLDLSMAFYAFPLHENSK